MTPSLNRLALLKIATLVRPAIATADYVPALTHIQFHDGFATAFNGMNAIAVEAPGIDINRCVPGDLLIRALGSFAGDNVGLTYTEKDSTLLLTSGRSRVKLPTLDPTKFPFKPPVDPGTEFILTKDMQGGIEECLLSVGKDGGHPAQMGVTLEPSRPAVLWSTDSITISRYQTKEDVEIPGDAPVILPTWFCEQLLTLRKAYPDASPILVLRPGAMFVDFVLGGNNTIATLFTKIPVDVTPLDFAAVVGRMCNPTTIKSALVTIPNDLDAAVGRAALIVGNETVRVTKVSVEKKVIYLSTSSAMGQVDDDMPYAATDQKQFYTDPILLARGLKACSKMAILSKAVLLGDDSGDFLHFVSNVEV